MEYGEILISTGMQDELQLAYLFLLEGLRHFCVHKVPKGGPEFDVSILLALFGNQIELSMWLRSCPSFPPTVHPEREFSVARLGLRGPHQRLHDFHIG